MCPEAALLATGRYGRLGGVGATAAAMCGRCAVGVVGGDRPAELPTAVPGGGDVFTSAAVVVV